MINAAAFLGPEPVLLVLVVALVLFGGQKVPELMRGLGQDPGEMKKNVDGVKSPLGANEPR